MNEAKLLEQAKKDGITQFSTGVAALCVGQVLIVKRKKESFMGGRWELPGGKLDAGEGIIIGAIRELKEETNLEASRIISYLGSFDYTAKNDKKTRQFNYLAEIKAPADVKLTEHDAFEWCHPQQITQEVSPEIKAIIGVASKFIKEE